MEKEKNNEIITLINIMGSVVQRKMVDELLN